MSKCRSWNDWWKVIDRRPGTGPQLSQKWRWPDLFVEFLSTHLAILTFCRPMDGCCCAIPIIYPSRQGVCLQDMRLPECRKFVRETSVSGAHVGAGALTCPGEGARESERAGSYMSLELSKTALPTCLKNLAF